MTARSQHLVHGHVLGFTFDPLHLILTNYFALPDEKIVGLVIVFKKPSPY